MASEEPPVGLTQETRKRTIEGLEQHRGTVPPDDLERVQDLWRQRDRENIESPLPTMHEDPPKPNLT